MTFPIFMSIDSLGINLDARVEIMLDERKPDSTYISSIVTNSEVRTRQFWLAEALIIFESLVELLGKSFMSWSRKHAEQNYARFSAKITRHKHQKSLMVENPI
mgnify:CR=1 FL=1